MRREGLLNTLDRDAAVRELASAHKAAESSLQQQPPPRNEVEAQWGGGGGDGEADGLEGSVRCGDEESGGADVQRRLDMLQVQALRVLFANALAVWLRANV